MRRSEYYVFEILAHLVFLARVEFFLDLDESPRDSYGKIMASLREEDSKGLRL